MIISVRVHAELQCYTGDEGTFSLEVEPGTTAQQLLQRLGIPEGEVYAVVVDRQIASNSTALTPGAHVDLIPPLGGGH